MKCHYIKTDKDGTSYCSLAEQNGQENATLRARIAELEAQAEHSRKLATPRDYTQALLAEYRAKEGLPTDALKLAEPLCQRINELSAEVARLTAPPSEGEIALAVESIMPYMNGIVMAVYSHGVDNGDMARLKDMTFDIIAKAAIEKFMEGRR